MFASELNSKALTPSFNAPDQPLPPAPSRLGFRKSYYYLVNIEEHPEVLPLAFDAVTRRLAGVKTEWGPLATPAKSAEDAAARLPALIQRIEEQPSRNSNDWRSAGDDLKRRQVLHYFMQYMPMAVVDGCWLQCGSRVATAHTKVGAALTGLYQHQLRAFVADPGRHFVGDYIAAYSRLGSPLEDISSRSFADRTDFLESTFALPIFLMSIGQFTRSLFPEIVGVNLAWQFLGVSAFGPNLIHDICEAYGLPPLGRDLLDEGHFGTGREMARAAAVQLFEDASVAALNETWTGLLRGVAAGIEAWTQWLEEVRKSAPTGAPDPQQEMIDLLWRKAPHARGYHSARTLGSQKIDEHLNPDTFDGPALLTALAGSPWVKPGKADKSALLKRLIGFGGPMLGVFSPVEQQIMQNWIESLPSDEEKSGEGKAAALAQSKPIKPTVREEQYLEGRLWKPEEFRQRSEALYGKCSVRELYHRLVNIEFYPDILPVAERFARDRLERSMATMWKGERAIPSRQYNPAALEEWVYTKHREQVDSYRPPATRPEVPRDAFVEATVQLAPLILIDGGWLQGIASPALVHTTVGRMLFHVFVEEIGEGKVKEHHANIYRNLLAAMGLTVPPVDTWEFAQWPRLQDSSFDVPALWLSISCFPRHFLPEILGLNLAVELAGVGGPYMEARDTLRRFRYPTLFVDVHNAADNVTAGHAAWAMDAIKRHMDEVAERDGPHGVDRIWQRVWTGVRATLPQIGRTRLIAHRLKQRFFGEDPRLVPLIFPS